ncbi:hypothetical protein ID0397_10820 [Helicobacter pylori]
MKSQMQICNNTAGCSASMNTSYFQMPVEFGFRSNFSKHSGIEVGFNRFYFLLWLVFSKVILISKNSL